MHENALSRAGCPHTRPHSSYPIISFWPCSAYCKRRFCVISGWAKTACPCTHSFDGGCRWALGGGERGGTTVPPTMFTNSRRLGHMRRKSQVFNKFPQVWVEDRYSKCEALLDEVSVLIKNLSENGLRRKTQVEEEGSAEKGGREGHGNRSKGPDEQVETKHQDRRPAVPTTPGRTEEEDHRGHVGALFHVVPLAT